MNKKWGTVISLIAMICWIFVIPMGVMNLWTTMGNMRKYVVGACIIVSVSLYIMQNRKKSKNTEVS